MAELKLDFENGFKFDKNIKILYIDVSIIQSGII